MACITVAQHGARHSAALCSKKQGDSIKIVEAVAAVVAR
jgi:hypothetical protein